MLRIVGANFDQCSENFSVRLTNGVFVILDLPHMIKSIRNAFECYGIITDRTGGKIECDYLVDLNNLHKLIGQHYANKLRDKHIHFKDHKMKVVLAVQLLSPRSKTVPQKN